MSPRPLASLQHRRLRRLRTASLHKARTLEKARFLLKTIVDHTPVSLLLLDAEGRVVEANRLAHRVHGMDPVGQPCHRVMAERSELCEGCGLEQKDLRLLACEERTDSRTGEVLSSEVVPVTFEDGKRSALVVEHIVTEQRKLEARLVHQEKMAALGLLSAGIAHELGNPLSAVEMNVRLLEQDRLDEEGRGRVGEIRREVERLRRTLREMVDFARRRRDEAGWVSVQAVVEDALRICRHDPRMRRIELHSSFDPETPPVLLINALDAMPEGGRLEVELGPVEGGVRLRIEDDGEGMDEEARARCFEPLYTTKEAGKGTGLGLSISRDIVEGAGGRLQLQSQPEQGTRVLVELPGGEGA